MRFLFSSPTLPEEGVLVLPVFEGAFLSEQGLTLDLQTQGKLKQAIEKTAFSGKKEKILEFAFPFGLNYERLFLLGMGNKQEISPQSFERLGGFLTGALLAAQCTKATIALGEDILENHTLVAAFAAGMKLRSYRFSKYKTQNPEQEERVLEEITFSVSNPTLAKKTFKEHETWIDGVFLARDLVQEPANVLTPKEFAKRAQDLEKLGVEVEIFTPKDLKKIGMHAFLAVGQGSSNPSRLVVLQWKGDKTHTPPLALIGKGVTFDSGGISIKPAAGMEDMKADMAGAAAVLGAMAALASRKAKAHVVALLGCVENMPDGKAQRPGDIVHSLSGKTIAVLNTDAEGRLILADMLTYTQDRFKPSAIIDLATLTGAILVALGKEYAGLFSNNDLLSQNLLDAGLKTGDKLWRLPMAPEYDKLIDSESADMKNTGGKYAGAITAAHFLKRFINNDIAWAHIDLAGTAIDSPKTTTNQAWASGFGVRLLDELVRLGYETKKDT